MSKLNTATSIRRTKKNTQSTRRNWSIALLALGLLLLAIAVFKGDAWWTSIRAIIYKVFGWCTVLLGPLLIYISISLANDTCKASVTRELCQGFALTLLLGSITHICQLDNHNLNISIMQYITAFSNTEAGWHGGLISGILTRPLVKICGAYGAGIIICILILVFILLVLRVTIVDIYKYVKRTKTKKMTAKKVGINPPKAAEATPEASHNKSWLGTIANEAASFKPTQSKTAADQKRQTKETEQPDLKTDLPFEQIEEYQQNFQKLVEEKREPPAEIIAEPETNEAGTELDEQGEQDDYIFPDLGLLNETKQKDQKQMNEELQSTATKLTETLANFGVGATIVDISKGPAVTRYELQPAVGVKISKITGLADDIALNLATAGVRIEAPVPNKAAVGIEVPNKTTSIVGIKEVLESEDFKTSKSKLSIVLGKDISGNFTIADIAKMPHILIAGSTGSGKSVCINSIIMSLLYKSSPTDVRLLLIDPKVVELGVYNGIPQLLVPVVTNAKKASGALGWAVCEMMNRYKIFAENSVRDLEKYNELVKDREDLEKLPQVVIVIDELADLMMVAPNEVEDSICRLAQMARAAGMHLVIATQRPSVDVITGIIKANIPSRVAFAVSSQVDSRTILDASGAEKLLGRGDMLFLPTGISKPIRVQGCFVTDKEVERVVNFIKQNQEVNYSDDVVKEIEKHAEKAQQGKKQETLSNQNSMLDQATQCVVEAGQASTSLLQRRLKIGYSRAARLLDELEEKGIVSESDGSHPRKVYITKHEWLEMQSRAEP
ncbi:MAG: DNA translocase FtsK [Oscillospiraceae bacterium]|jgi:S-DNA-T family DNA segregation ATPase FtsK/SpoIIIE|nr:DNA translocase FtsK [Oscillospiraceae bacterium]